MTDEYVNPKVLIVPQSDGKILTLPMGSLFMSGAKLYVTTAVGTNQLITST